MKPIQIPRAVCKARSSLADGRTLEFKESCIKISVSFVADMELQALNLLSKDFVLADSKCQVIDSRGVPTNKVAGLPECVV